MHQKNVKFCHYWFFKENGFESEEHVCDRCHYILTTGNSLKNVFNFGAKGGTYRCILTGNSKNKML